MKYDDEDGKVKMKRKKYRSPPTETSTSKREKQLTSPRGNPRLLLISASPTPSLHFSWNHGARRLRRHILGSTAAKTRWKQARGAAAELRQPTPWWHRGSQAATIGLIMGLHILEENPAHATSVIGSANRINTRRNTKWREAQQLGCLISLLWRGW